MAFNDFSRHELVRMLELIEASLDCCDSSGVSELILRARELFEAEYAVCGLLEAGSPVVAASVNGNYPREWVDRYISGRRSLADPVVRFHSRYAVTRTWSEVFREYDDPAACRLVSDARDYGLNCGISGAIYLPDADKIAIFTFADKTDRFNDRHKIILDALAVHFSGALARSVRVLPDRVEPSVPLQIS